LTQTEHHLVPRLTFPADFADDWERFDEKTRVGIANFLKRLQADPFDPAIVAMSEKNSGYFATPIGPLVIYWTLARKNESFETALAPPDAIYVLAIHPADQLAQ
jgi:hypothetical protein